MRRGRAGSVCAAARALRVMRRVLRAAGRRDGRAGATAARAGH